MRTESESPEEESQRRLVFAGQEGDGQLHFGHHARNLYTDHVGALLDGLLKDQQPGQVISVEFFERLREFLRQ